MKVSRTDTRQSNQALKLCGKTLSRTSTSFPRRFNILPDGVISKNPTGDRSMPNSNSICSSLLLRMHPTAIVSCASSTNVTESCFNHIYIYMIFYSVLRPTCCDGMAYKLSYKLQRKFNPLPPKFLEIICCRLNISLHRKGEKPCRYFKILTKSRINNSILF